MTLTPFAWMFIVACLGGLFPLTYVTERIGAGRTQLDGSFTLALGSLALLFIVGSGLIWGYAGNMQVAVMRGVVFVLMYISLALLILSAGALAFACAGQGALRRFLATPRPLLYLALALALFAGLLRFISF